MVKRSSNVDKAFCTVCGKDFSISAIGESAVSTHALLVCSVHIFNITYL